MPKKAAQVSRLTQEDLASRPHSDLRDLIIEDIRRKGLRDGDRYLGADGVGELLGVSTVTANRLLASMAEENLVKLIRWLRADQNPHYALLPREKYDAKWKAWGLPNPAQVEALR